MAATTDAPAPSVVTVLVGGVGQLYQGDLDVGRRIAERLAAEDLGAGVVVEDLSYGAVAVVQRIEELAPHTLVLAGAAERLRAPGTVERRRVRDPGLPADELQLAVGEAVTGYVTLDLVIEVCCALGHLPARTAAIEIEPLRCDPNEELSPAVADALDAALALVRAEVARALIEPADVPGVVD